MDKSATLSVHDLSNTVPLLKFLRVHAIVDRDEVCGYVNMQQPADLVSSTVARSSLERYTSRSGGFLEVKMHLVRFRL
jgi:hypothetical protein